MKALQQKVVIFLCAVVETDCQRKRLYVIKSWFVRRLRRKSHCRTKNEGFAAKKLFCFVGTGEKIIADENMKGLWQKVLIIGNGLLRNKFRREKKASRQKILIFRRQCENTPHADGRTPSRFKTIRKRSLGLRGTRSDIWMPWSLRYTKKALGTLGDLQPLAQILQSQNPKLKVTLRLFPPVSSKILHPKPYLLQGPWGQKLR